MNAVADKMVGARVRPTPHYRFTPWDDLPERIKDEFRTEAIAVPAGLLRCRLASGSEPIWIDCSSATPWIEGEMRLTPDLPVQLLWDIAGLVLDAALQIETESDVVAGPSAFELLFGSQRITPPDDQIGRLSISALQHASQLENPGINDVTASLYFFNRLPASSSLHARFPSSDSVRRFLDVGCIMRDPKTAPVWQLTSSEREWIVWHRRGSDPTRPSANRYKLYISTHYESLPEVLAKVPKLLAEAGARAFKTGGTVHGLLRPDNFVAYMPSLKSVETAAAMIRREIGAVPRRAVPFTVQLGDDGLMSWGIDPRRGTACWYQGQSWRLWICQQLARAIIVARKLPVLAIEPWEFAMLRLLPAGVFPGKWRPHRDFDKWSR